MNPKLKPLFADLEEAGLQYYLATTDFQRLAIEHRFEDFWDVSLKQAKQQRTYLMAGFDHEPNDCFDALVILTNHFFIDTGVRRENLKNDFYKHEVLFQTLKGFCLWTKDWFDLGLVIHDLKLAGFNIEKFNSLIGLKIPDPKPKENKTISPDNTVSIKEKIDNTKRRLIALSEGKIEALIKELTEELIKNNEHNQSESQNNLINISSRWHRSNEFRRQGTISLDEFNLEMNKINDALRDLIQKHKAR